MYRVQAFTEASHFGFIRVSIGKEGSLPMIEEGSNILSPVPNNFIPETGDGCDVGVVVRQDTFKYGLFTFELNEVKFETDSPEPPPVTYLAYDPVLNLLKGSVDFSTVPSRLENFCIVGRPSSGRSLTAQDLAIYVLSPAIGFISSLDLSEDTSTAASFFYFCELLRHLELVLLGDWEGGEEEFLEAIENGALLDLDIRRQLGLPLNFAGFSDRDIASFISSSSVFDLLGEKISPSEGVRSESIFIFHTLLRIKTLFGGYENFLSAYDFDIVSML